jgi:hypothetical protein
MQWLYASGGRMKEHEMDLEKIRDGIAHLLGSIIMHREHFSSAEMIEIRSKAMQAFKAQTRTEALLAAEFDGVTPYDYSQDGT